MRIALFTDTFLPKVDGIVTVICLLLDHLAARGVEAMVFAPRLGQIDHYNQAKIITAPGIPFPFYPDLKLAAPTPHILRSLKAFAPSVVHFVHPSAFALACYAVVKRMDLATLVSFHIDYGQLGRHFRMGPFNAGVIEKPVNFLTRVVMNSADYALAPSPMIQRRLAAIGVKKEVGLWRRGVDAQRFHPRFFSAAMRARLSGGSSDAILLLYVGRLSHEKQLHHLREVLVAVPGTRLALVGDGPARLALAKHFSDMPVVFTGYLQGEMLSQAYSSADIFVFPSALESFGLVVVEAMAAGLPVVASRVGGVGDVVQEGRTGFIFEAGDTRRLVEGVQRVALDPALRREMSAHARAFAETQDWASIMDEVIEHYARLGG